MALTSKLLTKSSGRQHARWMSGRTAFVLVAVPVAAHPVSRPVAVLCPSPFPLHPEARKSREVQVLCRLFF